MLLDHLTDAASFTTMSSNSFFNSPTVVLPPNAPDQYFSSGHYVDQNNHAPAVNGISPNGLSNTNPFQPNGATDSVPVTPFASTPGSLAGRKRSRADIYSHDDEDDEHLDDGSVSTQPAADLKKPRGKPIYGPGMTVIYPEDPGYELAAESQSGTWVEEGAERKPFQLAHMKRPSMSSRKSQRKATADDDHLAQLVLPHSMREVTSEPLIDEATRVLGISWTRMDSTDSLRISQAAWSKWIQNHYHGLKDVTVWFENSAIPGYLVAAHNAYTNEQEYYIFANDLTEARLVTNDPTQLVPRLKMLPALHLAAPGGHIKAETDPITVAQNEITNAVMKETAAQESSPNGACAAHSMELD